MSILVKQLTEQALTLSTTEREQLASSLLESVHSKELTDVDQEWVALAEERYKDLVRGVDQGISEADFFAKVNERVQWN